MLFLQWAYDSSFGHFSLWFLHFEGLGWWYAIFTCFIFLWLPFRSNSHFPFLVIIISFMIWKHFMCGFLLCVFFFPVILVDYTASSLLLSAYMFKVSAVVSKSRWASVMATDGNSGFQLVLGTILITAFIIVLLDSSSSMISWRLPFRIASLECQRFIFLMFIKEKNNILNELIEESPFCEYFTLHSFPIYTNIVYNWMPTQVSHVFIFESNSSYPSRRRKYQYFQKLGKNFES